MSALEQVFLTELRHAGHRRRFSITSLRTAGWEIREELDDRVLKQVQYRDWHRVERARAVFSLHIATLEDTGWIPIAHPSTGGLPNHH